MPAIGAAEIPQDWQWVVGDIEHRSLDVEVENQRVIAHFISHPVSTTEGPRQLQSLDPHKAHLMSQEPLLVPSVIIKSFSGGLQECRVSSLDAFQFRHQLKLFEAAVEGTPNRHEIAVHINNPECQLEHPCFTPDQRSTLDAFERTQLDLEVTAS